MTKELTSAQKAFLASQNTPSEFKAAGWKPSDLIAIGWTLYDLKAAGWTPSDFLTAGWTPYDLKAIGWTPSEFKAIGWTPSNLIAIGWTLYDLISSEWTLSDFIDDGWTLYDFKATGWTPSDFKTIGWTLSDLTSEWNDIPVLEKPYTKLLNDIKEKKRIHKQSILSPDFDPKTNLCSTPMCTAGHLIDMAGEIGYKLKDKYGRVWAATLIHMKSRPDVPPQNFGDIPQDFAMAYIEQRAEEEEAASIDQPSKENQ